MKICLSEATQAEMFTDEAIYESFIHVRLSHIRQPPSHISAPSYSGGRRTEMHRYLEYN